MDWKKNRLWIAAAVLIAVIGLVVYATREQDRGDAPADETEALANALPDIDREAIDELEIRRPQEAPIRLVRDGEEWRLAAPVEAEADQAVVDTALQKLDELEVQRIAATNADNYDRLEVSDDKAVHVIAKADGEQVVHLLVGAGASGRTMVRIDGEQHVLAVAGLIKFAFNKGVGEWRNKRILDEAPDDVVGMHFENANGAWRFQREHGGSWTQAEGEEPIERFEAAKVQSIVTNLARLRATDFAAPDATIESTGLGEGAAKLTMTIREASTVDDTGEDEPEAGEGETEAGEETAEAGGEGEGEGPDEAGETPVPSRTVTLYVGSAAPAERQYYLRVDGDETIYIVTHFLQERIQVDVDAFQTAEEGEAIDDEGEDGSPLGAGPGGPLGGGPGGPLGGGPSPSAMLTPEQMEQIQRQIQQQMANMQ